METNQNVEISNKQDKNNILSGFIEEVKDEDLGVYGIHVYKDGKTIAEYRFRSNDRENLCSASKTFTAVGVGIAEKEGLISIEDSVLSYFPEYRRIAKEEAKDIKIVHLLQMTTGHSSQSIQGEKIDDLVELFFKLEITNPIGKVFYYDEIGAYMLGRIIEKVSGCKTFLDYLKPRLFDYLEIDNPQWHTCKLGHTDCSGGLYLTTEEFSRIGILLMQKGVYKGKIIITEDFVERMHSSWIDTQMKFDEETKQGYGYLVWKCTIPNSYRADGMYGQFCIVLEDYNAVITVTSHNEGNSKDILRSIWKNILPFLETMTY